MATAMEKTVSLPNEEDDKTKFSDTLLYHHYLGGGRYITILRRYAEILVMIREYEEKNGIPHPTGDEVILTKMRFASLVRSMARANEVFADIGNGRFANWPDPVAYSTHLGGAYALTICKDYPYVDIRKYVLLDGDKDDTPTDEGITLRLSEWYALTDIIPDILANIKELRDAKPCYKTTPHLIQDAWYQCVECNPYCMPR